MSRALALFWTPARGSGLGQTGLVLVAGVLIVLIWGQEYAGSVFVLSACAAELSSA